MAIQARVPSKQRILQANPNLKQYLEWSTNAGRRRQVFNTPFGILFPGQFVAGQSKNLLDELFMEKLGQTLLEVNQDAINVIAERALDRLEIKDDFSRILLKFPAALQQATEDEIQKAFKELDRAGRFLLESSDPEAGRWWKSETGRRKSERHTGKLFGSRNVVKGKLTKQGFEWPDRNSLKKHRHWRIVEFGNEQRRPMNPGWLAPHHKGGTTPTNSRFFKSSGKKPRSKGGVMWVGPRVSHGGRKGATEPLMVQNRPKHLIQRTQALVLGMDGDKLYEKFGESSGKALDELRARLRG